MHLIHGLADGRQAVYLKIHHAVVDGVSGNDLLTTLWDPTPNQVVAGAMPRAGAATVAESPGVAELLARSAFGILGHPRRAFKLAAGLGRPIGGVLRNASRVPKSISRITSAFAPPTPFNQSIGADRRLALRTVALDDVVTVKRAMGVTVNDVVLAMCASALRRWLERRAALPDTSLVVAVPMSTRRPGDGAGFGNKLTVLLANLPTQQHDSARRLQEIHRTMREAKNSQRSVSDDLLSDLMQFVAPAVAGRAFRLSTRLRVLERLNFFNLIVSNVPGPTGQLFLAGAPMRAYYPVSQLVDGQGLNITVFSYEGGLHIGVLADATLVPDADLIAADMANELVALVDRVNRGGETPVNPRP
jgi:WS/DGAT/MGAT family acyltransferase